jgi:hypothetical protein
VAHSLLGLPDSPRTRSLYERCKALAPRDLHMQRRLALLDEQPLAPSWTKVSLSSNAQIELEGDP